VGTKVVKILKKTNIKTILSVLDTHRTKEKLQRDTEDKGIFYKNPLLGGAGVGFFNPFTHP
jgi:phosphoribosylcarboxyaminoimidazole (NCAIR) mutase